MQSYHIAAMLLPQVAVARFFKTSSTQHTQRLSTTVSERNCLTIDRVYDGWNAQSAIIG